jgi:hypothetical protein
MLIAGGSEPVFFYDRWVHRKRIDHNAVKRQRRAESAGKRAHRKIAIARKRRLKKGNIKIYISNFNIEAPFESFFFRPFGA